MGHQVGPDVTGEKIKHFAQKVDLQTNIVWLAGTEQSRVTGRWAVSTVD